MLLISYMTYSQIPPAKIDVRPTGATIYGRAYYGNNPLTMAYIFVTDEDLKTLYGECVTLLEAGPNSGTYSIEGLPSNKNLKIFVFSDNIPGIVGFKEIKLETNEKRKVPLDFYLKFQDPGFVAEGLPDNMNISATGPAAAIMLVTNLANLLFTLIDQKSQSEDSFGTLRQLRELKANQGSGQQTSASISNKTTHTGSSVSQTGSVSDIDGNTYNTVTIGDQIWMKENLKVTRYNDGTEIPNITNAGVWTGLKTGAYCDYNNDESNSYRYGRIYNWYAVVDSRNLCPKGWHVPSDIEWKKLEIFLGMTQIQANAFDSWRGTIQGSQMKSSSGWSNNGNGTNTSKFTALPGGQRNGYGEFYELGSWGHWHSTTESGINNYRRSLANNQSKVNRYYTWKHCGYTVRCLKD